MFTKVISFSEQPIYLYDSNGDLAAKVLEVDVTGCWTKIPVGDGIFMDVFYSRMLTDKAVAVKFGKATLAFPKGNVGFVIELDDCIGLSDGTFLVNFHGYKKE